MVFSKIYIDSSSADISFYGTQRVGFYTGHVEGNLFTPEEKKQSRENTTTPLTNEEPISKGSGTTAATGRNIGISQVWLNSHRRFKDGCRESYIHSTLRELKGLQKFCRDIVPSLPRNLNYIIYYDCLSLDRRSIVSSMTKKERGQAARLLSEIHHTLSTHSIFTIHTQGSHNP